MGKKASLADAVEDTLVNDKELVKPESVEIVSKSDDCILTYYGKEIKTVDQLLQHAQIDLKIWQVVEHTINNWEVAGKRSMGQDSDKKWRPASLWKTGLRQISVKLKRLAPQPIQQGIVALMSNLKPLAPRSRPKIATDDLHMVELGIHDHHFGKFCWGKVTGTNWDLEIADREFRSCVDEMLARSKMFNIEQFVMPVGNDFFHVNDWLSQTANGTRVESVDDRFEKVFRVGCAAMQYAVERCIQIAPLKLIFVPGNHDRHTSWFMVEWLSAIFKNEPLVDVDSGPRSRKYFDYGPALLGYTHSDTVPSHDLPTLMATEAPEQWAKSRYRSWRVGHWHKRKETRYTAGDTFHGVEVRIFPSMCGTDQWHYDRGFVGNARMTECHIWSKQHGPVGHFVVNSKEPQVIQA